MTDGLITERLRAWVRAGAASSELLAADLHEDFCYEDGIFRVQPPDAAGHATMTNGRLEDVDVRAEVVTADSYVVVARGRDEVTGLWHQCVWVFLLREGLVHRLLVTISEVSPRPWDGTLRLREVADDGAGNAAQQAVEPADPAAGKSE